MNPRRALLAALVALAAAPGTAGAATVVANSTGILYRAAPGEVNDLTMGDAPARRRSVEERSAPLSVGAGCQIGAPVVCGIPGSDRDVVFLGDRDDKAFYFSGGGFSYLFGGRGDDDFFSGGGDAYGFGGPGDDDVRVNSNGHSEAHGGPGDDVVSGSGIVDYLYGDEGNDVLRQTGQFAPVVRGGPGADRLELSGFGGNLIGHGGQGNDTLIVVPNVHPSGSWTLIGGPGADLLVGGRGRDNLLGGPGNDRIVSTDNGLDVIDCGPGADSVTVDAGDRVTGGCEVVNVPDSP